MPEYRECLAAFKTIERWFKDISTGAIGLPLQAIWADATEDERNTSKDARVKNGLVYRLSHTTKIKRGTNRAQKPVYPPGVWSNRSKPAPLSLLNLQGVHTSPRNVILNLGKLWLQVQLHTHTLPQVYTRSQWDDSIAVVDSMSRGFKVGIALDFGEYVLAFDTLDNIYTPHWARTRADLPAQHVDVYSDYPKFLVTVAAWISQRQRSKTAVRTNLAVNVIRTDGHLCFGGIGSYTIVELFFSAGLSVFLTEAEVFDTPDRAARFCEAFWAFACHSHLHLDELLRPCWQGYILAATKDQRAKYSHWLRVFSKQQTHMPQRMYDLLESYNVIISSFEETNDTAVRNSSIGLFDVFEPTYIRLGLEKEVNLGHLIFGEEKWRQLGGTVSQQDDALTQLFRQTGLYPSSQSFINVSLYDPLFLEPRDMRKRAVTPYLYSGDHQKQLWTITHNFPDSLVHGVRNKLTRSNRRATDKALFCVTPDVRLTHTFLHVITHTRRAAVGPLEYCGVARLIHRQHAGKADPLVSLCRHDPCIPETYRNRELAGIDRITDGRQRRGASHATGNGQYGRGGWRKRSFVDLEDEISDDKPCDVLGHSPSANGVKRRRLGVDTP
ncbi:hypothetical protein BV22DRAFT_1050902 [Leucogyrophana mollusca]|uniref:Uncharacterized protein n=1 Tax=Leucogyrophana mollusca TaxID=85980 RepID=A0ACB8B269_9AGAM|nr:hypothetical protein BV22DRAFT_1050902 [Leucogyrophana mollusca]